MDIGLFDTSYRDLILSLYNPWAYNATTIMRAGWSLNYGRVICGERAIKVIRRASASVKSLSLICYSATALNVLLIFLDSVSRRPASSLRSNSPKRDHPTIKHLYELLIKNIYLFICSRETKWAIFNATWIFKRTYGPFFQEKLVQKNSTELKKLKKIQRNSKQFKHSMKCLVNLTRIRVKYALTIFSS